MDHNSSIECNVSECKNHCKDDDFCTLDKIKVTKNDKAQQATTSSIEATDCSNFELR